MKKAQVLVRRAAALVTLFLILAAGCQAQDVTAKAEEYLNALAKQGRFNGAVLGARDGKVLLSQGYGMANLEHDVPNTPRTKFRLGSITKQFTAAAVLLLQERGKLSVQDAVCKYVAACPEAWKEVTIHHLLSHTGGLPNFTGFPDYQKTMMVPATMESLLARFKDRPLDFKPSEKWNYSNSGYVLLGHVLEQVTGQSYEQFLQEQVFGPLKMANTGYDRHERVLKGRATGYSRRGEQVVNSDYLAMTIPHAAGALYSTVEDLLLWQQGLFGGKLLSPQSLAVMLTPVKNDYGYGVGVNRQFNRQSISHGGGINGFSTFLTYYPDEKVTIAVLRNFDGGSPGPGAIARDLAAIAFGEKYELPRERVAIKVDPKIYDAYVGRYELTPTFSLTIAREGDRLMGHPTGQPPAELFPESETKFFLKVVDAQITFVKDEKGQVTGLILHQGGDRRAQKVK